MRSSIGIITMFDFSMPFFTPITITAHVTAVNTVMQTNGSHGAATKESKNALGSARTASPPATSLT